MIMKMTFEQARIAHLEEALDKAAKLLDNAVARIKVLENDMMFRRRNESYSW
jgi:hypothetical protein